MSTCAQAGPPEEAADECARNSNNYRLSRNDFPTLWAAVRRLTTRPLAGPLSSRAHCLAGHWRSPLPVLVVVVVSGGGGGGSVRRRPSSVVNEVHKWIASACRQALI